MKLVIDQKARKGRIEFDLDEPRMSASGKSLVVGSSQGNVQTDQLVNGKPVIVGFNAYIKA